MIYLTSDPHFCHDRDFIYKPRGFDSINAMTSALIENWNSTVAATDTIYICGDFCLGIDYDCIEEIVGQLNGTKHLIIGNHDTPAKLDFYERKFGISCKYADLLVYRKQQFYLSHYPTLTANPEFKAKKNVVNLFGHTHSKEKFYNDNPYMYNVSVDANDNRPVSIDEIYEAVAAKEELT